MDWEFIKMCQKAEEIQQLWKPKSGDLFMYKVAFGPRPWMLSPDIEGAIITWEGKQKDRFWLPRQEDLQKICMEQQFPDARSLKLNFEARDFPFEDLNKEWILFTMEFCFGKIWNPEKRTWEAL